MARIDTDAIREALSVIDYGHVLGLSLRSAGKWMRGDCPLCDATSRAPFCVIDDVFICHACNQSGDVFDLCQLLQLCSFREAAAQLASIAGVDPEERLDDAELARRRREREARNAQRKQEAVARQRAAEARAPAVWEWLPRQSEPGLAYLKRRGVADVAHEVRFSASGVWLPLRQVDGTITNVVGRRIDNEEPKVRGLTGCGTLGAFGDPSRLGRYCVSAGSERSQPSTAGTCAKIERSRRSTTGASAESERLGQPSAGSERSQQPSAGSNTELDRRQRSTDHFGGPIIIVEGVFDWLSARVLAPKQPVLGAHGGGRLPDVIRMIATHGRERGFVFVPHKDKAGQQQVAKAIGVARDLGVPEIHIYVVDVGDGCKDLNDHLIKHGTKSQLFTNLTSSADKPMNAVKQPTATSNSDPTIEWEVAEPLPQERRAIPVLTGALLPEPFRPWLTDIAERAQIPLEYPTAAAIVATSAAIGRRCAIRPKRCDDWTVVPNLWGAIVGSPGVMKSAPVQEVLKPLRHLQKLACEQHKHDKAAYDESLPVVKEKIAAIKRQIKQLVQQGIEPTELQKQLAELAQPPPDMQRLIVHDSTTEKLGELLNKNPFGILCYRDELAGWLKLFGKPGREGDRAFYLETWNGDGSYIYDRISRGTTFIEAACVSIIGTIQPGPISEYLQGAFGHSSSADGLMQRFQIVVYPDVPATWELIDRWPDIDAKNRARNIFEQLVAMADYPPTSERTDSGIPYLRFSPEAQEYFYAWYTGLERYLRHNDDHPAIVEHMAKFRSLMPSLALQFHLVEWAAGCEPLGPVSFHAAELAALWCEVLEQHARKLYATSTGSASSAVHLLAKKIRSGKLRDGFTVSELSRKCWAGLTERDVLVNALKALEELNWLRVRRVPKRGRPRLEYLINPNLTARAR